MIAETFHKQLFLKNLFILFSEYNLCINTEINISTLENETILKNVLFDYENKIITYQDNEETICLTVKNL